MTTSFRHSKAVYPKGFPSRSLGTRRRSGGLAFPRFLTRSSVELGNETKCLPVNVLPVANLDDLHDQVLIFDGIKDAVTSWSHPVLLLP